MADIKVRIEVNPNAETEKIGDINNVNAEISNVSFKTNSDNIFQNIPTSESVGINGLSWANTFINEKGEEDSYLVFDGQDYIDNEDLRGGVIDSEQEPTEFVWGVVPYNKEYSVKLTFTNATALKDIVVYGDKTSNQFPTRAIIDGTTEIFSDDYRWAINLQTESDTHTIEFTHWNRANYNACLTLIRVMLRYFEVNNRTGLKSIESLSQSTGQPKEIFYGVIPSSGSVEIIDVDGEIADMVRDGVIPSSNVVVDVLANGNNIQQHIVNDSDYLKDKTFNLSLNNKLSAWDNIKYAGRRLTNRIDAYWVLRDILISVPYTNDEIREMFDTYLLLGEKKEMTVREYLGNIIIPYPYLEAGTIREAVDKICSLAQLNVIQKDDGKIKFVSARPRMLSSDNVLKILPNQYSPNQKKDFIVKNKKTDVNINKYDYVGEFRAFGDSYTIVFEEDSGTYTKENGFNVSNYNVVYNTNKNPFNGNTEIITRVKTYEDHTIEDDYYKTSLSFKIDDIIKDYSSIEISFNSEIKGSNLATINGTDVRYRPYKTMSYSGVIQRNSSAGGLIIENFVIDNNIVNFDILARYDTRFTGSGTFIDSLDYYTKIEVRLCGYVYDRYLKNEYNDSLIDNDLIQQDCMYAESFIDPNSYYIYIDELIKQNIINDYSNGILTAQITCSCGDYYDINNNLIKNWSKGDVLQLGDIVRVDKDNNGTSLWSYADGTPMYWKVTGRKFRYAGVPLIDLELQEVRVVE